MNPEDSPAPAGPPADAELADRDAAAAADTRASTPDAPADDAATDDAPSPAEPAADAPPADPPSGPRFTDLDLPAPLLRALTEDGYDTPSAIQAQVIPHVLAGTDVIGQAQTGTGKTAAFALPALARLAAADGDGDGDAKAAGPRVLVLAPTRELAIQVAVAFTRYGRFLQNLRTVAVYGGADMHGQIRELKRGVDVVVGTPGRVTDHLRRGTLDPSNIQTLVLDEADEMLRMGFVEDVEWVLEQIPAERQVALFSATMPPPIKAIAEKQLRDPVRIKTDGGSKTAETVSQRYWRVQGTHKFDALCRLLAYEDVGSAIVFVRTRAATAELARGLQEAGFPAAALSGDIAQNHRERTVNELRDGRLKLVVATDVAARGIDVESITHVFNYDIPHDTEAYIHRIGRTGRAGREGHAVLFVANRERHLLKNIERATGKPIDKMELPTAEDLHRLQLDRFGEKLRERLSRSSKSGQPGGGHEPAALRGFVEEICEATGRDAADVAAFLVGPAMAGVGIANPAAAAPANPHHRDDDGPRRPERGERFDRGPRPDRGPADGPKQNYRVAVGERDGLRPGHLVGAICNETGLDGSAIGSIKVHQSYATIELPPGMPREVFQQLQRTVVLGRPLRIKPTDERGSPGDFKPHRGKGKPPRIGHAPAFDNERGDRDERPFKPKPKPAGKFKPRPSVATNPPGSKPGNKFAAKPGGKLAGKPGKFNKPGDKPSAGPRKFKPAGKPGAGVRSAKPTGDGPHRLAPAAGPFAGGNKPKRPNKRR